MPYKNIDASLATADEKAVKDAFATVLAKLPFLVNLTASERQSGVHIACAVEDADDFDAAFVGQQAVEDQVLRKVRYFPRAQVLPLRSWK